MAWFTISYAFGQNQDTVAFNNVNVIPMTEEMVFPNKRVIIANGKIIMVEPASKPIQYEVSTTIDGTGKYLMPGFSEMHFHLRTDDIESNLKLLIANGITTVRNMAEMPEQDQIAIRDKLLSNGTPVPNYFTTGPYLQSADLQTEEQAIEVVQMHKRRGYDFVKIADNLPENIYLKLLEEGQKNNIPIIGHAQRKLPLEYSLRMKSIEHIEEFLYVSEKTQNNLLFDYDLADLHEVGQKIKQSGIYVGTTMAIFDFINACLNDDRFAQLQTHEWTKYLARTEREGFLTEKNDYRKMKNKKFGGVEASTLFHQYFVWMQKFSRIFVDNQVPLLICSDTYGMVIPGFSLHQEFRFLQDAGIKPYDILLASIVNPARYLHIYSTEGTIAKGKNANLVLLDKNPLEDIENKTSIEGVMVKGHYYDRSQLNKMLREVEEAFR
ncbi:MAG: amidohydrolase family protein [Pricia sp.]|nr:amidohydrolase family protein [Pricia sp.]